MRNTKSKITVAALTMIAMVFTMMPGLVFAAEEPTKVTVTFSAATAEEFDMLPQSLEVADNLTETYYPGVTVEPKGKVTVSDAIVAAHIAMYGKDYTGNPTAYYNVEDGSYQSGFVSKQFQRDLVGMYYINGESAPKGVCLDTLEEGDILETGAYADNTYTDLYSSFDSRTYRGDAGKAVEVKLQANNWGTPAVPEKGTKIMLLDKATGQMKPAGAVTDETGKASLLFEKGGTYCISAVGKVTYTGYAGQTTGNILAPYAEVVITEKTVTPVLKVPGSVKAVSTNAAGIKISWKKVSGASVYEIKRATSKTGTYKTVKKTASLNYTDKNVTVGKNYYYKVRACKGTNCGSFSKVAKATVKPAAPAVKVKAGTKTAKVSWKKVSKAKGYQVYRAASQNGSYKKVASVSSKNTSVKIGNLKSKKTSYFKVRAYTKVKGKVIYGSFSKVKAVKIK